MARHFYRFYLYSVYTFLLIFISVPTGKLLNTWLNTTSLRSFYSEPPTHEQLVQAIVLAIVTWIFGGALAALHGWLIRRDARHDPTAANSVIRALFLTITETIGIVIAVFFMGFGLIGEATSYSGATTSQSSGALPVAIAFALPSLIIVALLEWERRRTQATCGLALFFQRLFFYRTQLDLLFFLTLGWFIAFRPFVDTVFFGGKAALAACQSQGLTGMYSGDCPKYRPYYLLGTLLWFILFWLGSAWLTRKDNSRTMRLLASGISLALGIGFLLGGIYRGIKLLLLPLFKLPPASLQDILGSSSGRFGPSYDFVSPLVLGLLILGVSLFHLHRAAKRELISRASKCSMELAIAALVSAVFFWTGCGVGLYYLFETISRTSSDLLPWWLPTVDAKSWISTIALIVASLGYIPLEIILRRRQAKDPSTSGAPLCGYILALLKAGVLAWVIGGISLVYIWVSGLFGCPVANWLQSTHLGLANFIVGVLLMSIYLWSALRAGYWKQLVKMAIPASAAPKAAEEEGDFAHLADQDAEPLTQSDSQDPEQLPLPDSASPNPISDSPEPEMNSEDLSSEANSEE